MREIKYVTRCCLRDWQGGQEKELVTRCHVIEKTLLELEEKKLAEEDKISECCDWLQQSADAIGRCPADFDRAWASLLEIRHRFCWMLPPRGLVRVALDVGGDKLYLKDDNTKRKYRNEIDRLVGKLQALQKRTTPADSRTLTACRVDLAHLSMMGAEARQGQWYKINLYRARLASTARALCAVEALAVAALIYAPQVLGSVPYSWVVVLGVVIFGGIGGFLSALKMKEPLTQGSPAFYVERESIALRPIVGAAAGLIVFFLQLCGILTVGASGSPQVAFFVAAFCAGFSERFFVKRLEPMLGADGKSKAAKDAT
jgi:hypothetical protein